MRFNYSTVTISFLSLAGIVMLFDRYVDTRAALFVKNHLHADTAFGRHFSSMPDTLALVVVITTLVSTACYIFRTRHGMFDAHTSFFLAVAVAAPVSYLFKILLKLLFGRVTTRVWLRQPELYGFHWFNGSGSFDGFPSGHMVVFTALCAALWRYYPRWRLPSATLLVLLAVALIATNYHFLGDVAAGAYAGILIEAATSYGLMRSGRRYDNSRASISKHHIPLI